MESQINLQSVLDIPENQELISQPNVGLLSQP